MPLKIIDSPYRGVTRPVVGYVRCIRRESPRDVSASSFPNMSSATGGRWENLLHNQSALWLKSRLLFTPGVRVTSVPWQPTSSARDDHPVGPTPGSVRRGEPPNSTGRPERPPGSRRS